MKCITITAISSETKPEVTELETKPEVTELGDILPIFALLGAAAVAYYIRRR